MKAIKKYLITLACGLAGVAYVLWMKDFFNQTDMKTIFHILCDAFFVIGVLITSIGLFIFVSNEGVFDGLVYGVKSFAGLFRRNSRQYASYYDYKEAHADRDTPFGFLVFSGLFFIAVSLVMLYLYYQY